MGSQKGDDLIVGEAAGMGETVHSTANFNVDVPVVKEQQGV